MTTHVFIILSIISGLNEPLSLDHGGAVQRALSSPPLLLTARMRGVDGDKRQGRLEWGGF